MLFVAPVQARAASALIRSRKSMVCDPLLRPLAEAFGARAMSGGSTTTISRKAEDYLMRVNKFMAEHVAPAEDEVTRHA